MGVLKRLFAVTVSGAILAGSINVFGEQNDVETLKNEICEKIEESNSVMLNIEYDNGIYDLYVNKDSNNNLAFDFSLDRGENSKYSLKDVARLVDENMYLNLKAATGVMGEDTETLTTLLSNFGIDSEWIGIDFSEFKNEELIDAIKGFKDISNDKIAGVFFNQCTAIDNGVQFIINEDSLITLKDAIVDEIDANKDEYEKVVKDLQNNFDVEDFLNNNKYTNSFFENIGPVVNVNKESIINKIKGLNDKDTFSIDSIKDIELNMGDISGIFTLSKVDDSIVAYLEVSKNASEDDVSTVIINASFSVSDSIEELSVPEDVDDLSHIMQGISNLLYSFYESIDSLGEIETEDYIDDLTEDYDEVTTETVND